MTLPGAADALLIAGPTASGKSALALELARAMNGVIINADSMQVYSDLDILTACPGPEEHRMAPHRLYRYMQGEDVCSAARWATDAEREIKAAHRAGQMPVLVGGTGLYFRALVDGLSDMPDIPSAVRDAVRAALAKDGPEFLYQRLADVDPDTAQRLAPADGQRIARALEVFEASGRPISRFQTAPGSGPLGPAFEAGRVGAFVIDWPRDVLYARCDRRFDAMLKAGALEEVTHLMARELPDDRPVMKALGVPQLSAYLRGSLSLEAAAERAKMQTRRFAKRQMTWFRNQTESWVRIDGQELDAETAKIIQNWH